MVRCLSTSFVVRQWSINGIPLLLRTAPYRVAIITPLMYNAGSCLHTRLYAPRPSVQMKEPWRETLVYGFTCVHRTLTKHPVLWPGHLQPLFYPTFRIFFLVEYRASNNHATITNVWYHQKVSIFVSNRQRSRYSLRFFADKTNWILKLSCIQ